MSESRSPRRNPRSFADLDPVGQDEEGLLAALERSESVLDHQLEALADLDSKAVWTVRLELVLIGVLASVPKSVEVVTMTIPTQLGGLLLVCSMIGGIVTYGASRPDAGPGPRYVHSLAVSKADESEWYLELLDGYDVAIDHNRSVIEQNATNLFRTQLLFVLGVISFAVGFVLAV